MFSLIFISLSLVGYKPSVAVDGSGFITGMAYHEAAASNRQLRKEIEQHEIDYKKLKDEFISLREALEEERYVF